MKRELPFDDERPAPASRPLVGAVLRKLDFDCQWEKVEQIVLDRSVWEAENLMTDSQAQPVHLFCTATCRSSQVFGQDQLAAENPELFEHLCGYSPLGIDLARHILQMPKAPPSAEYVGAWLEGVKRLWPNEFGIFQAGWAYYRDEHGIFWQVQLQESEFDLSHPRIYLTEDVAANELPRLGAVTEPFDQLDKKLQSAAAERGWKVPCMLVAWYYEPSDGRLGYSPSQDILLIRDEQTLSQVRAAADELRQREQQPVDANSASGTIERILGIQEVFSVLGWPQVYGVDLLCFDVKRGKG